MGIIIKIRVMTVMRNAVLNVNLEADSSPIVFRMPPAGEPR